MQIFLWIAAIIALITGIVLWVNPKLLIYTGDVLNKEFETDTVFLKKRITFGILLIFLGGLMIYTLIWI
ncbi:MAG: hypothetical protein IIB95_04970 [Candidatus Marinimicrobia bacterium]|nr:hypothetical protein [Candidatus Neomarinimicrobiota bacterium]MCH7763078.1 hypothetical protein [Candidatus Neomarinimicrobiota bacterium]